MHPRLRRLVVLPLLLITVTACGTAGSSSPPSEAASAVASPDASLAPSGAPTSAGSPSASAAPASMEPTQAPTTSQTDTEWGRIWDDLPAGFPRFAGSTPADDATAEAVSGVFAVQGGDPAEIAAWMQAALETATYSTEALSGPLEDGSLVLDSVGDGDCRIQTVVAPMGGMTMLTVRYGAACPNP